MTDKKPDRQEIQEAEARDARKELDRLSAQSEVLGTSSMARMANTVRNHMMGADADQEDRVEVWGRRVGRFLGVLFLIYLVYHLIQFLGR